MGSQKGKPTWTQDYGMKTEVPKRVAKGRERVDRRAEMLGSPLPSPGSPLEGVVKAQRSRRMIPNPLTSPHHLLESAKIENMFSPLKISKEIQRGIYYGPGLRESAWHLWDRSDGQSQHRITYRTFYNTKWGVAVELDMTSFGSFRYTIGDFSKPILVTRSGIQQNIEAFGAPKLMHELKTKQRVGQVRMASHCEYFGAWKAEVKGMTILLSQSDPPNPAGALQLLLHPNGFVFVGETMSILSRPTAFQVEGGKVPIPCTLEQGREKVLQEINASNAPGFQQMPTKAIGKIGRASDAESYRGAAEFGMGNATRSQSTGSLDQGEHTGDWMGSLRRAIKSRTLMQRADDEAAEAFLKLPSDLRRDAVIFVEKQKAQRDYRNGILSEEEYRDRVSTIEDRTTFPASALRAADSLQLSMFCDKQSKLHKPNSEFGGII